MRNHTVKTFTVLFLLISLVFGTVSGAYAGRSTENKGSSNKTAASASSSSLEERLLKVPSFKFMNHQNGINCDKCPVYTAPSLDAYRCADGKASVDTRYYMSEAGKDRSGWLLVRYDTNNGGSRVGYIPPSYTKNFKSDMDFPAFDYIPATATATINVTDNVYMRNSSFAALDPGETFYILGKYTYLKDPTFWYIEFYVDDQLARGFIDRDSSSFVLGADSDYYFSYSSSYSSDYSSAGSYADSTSVYSGYPSVSPLGTTMDGFFKLYETDQRKNVRKSADKNAERISSVYNGVLYPCYGSRNGSDGKVWYYIWIETDSLWGWVSSTLGYITY